MVRKFNLLNEKGQSFSLMDIYNYCFLTDPSGLGYGYETSYESLGNIFILNLRKNLQNTITGTLNFINYDNYKKFVDFIENSEELKFEYTIPYKDKEKTFLKDILLQEISKSEIKENGIISEDVKFDCLSLWYEENIAIYSMKAQDSELRWDFKWDSKFTDYSSRTLKYVNTGHIEAPVLIEIEGEAIIPKIELLVEGELYQTLEIQTTIAEYEKLLYCTRENNFYINKQNTDGTIENLFKEGYIDINNDNVIRLPKNRSCEIRLSAQNEIRNAKITIYPQYKAV